MRRRDRVPGCIFIGSGRYVYLDAAERLGLVLELLVDRP